MVGGHGQHAPVAGPHQYREVMAHPRMYDDADPVLGRVRQVCLALPEATERESHGRPNFWANKVFAVYGSGLEHPSALILRIDPAELPALRADDRFFVAKYYPDRLALDVAAPATDWDEVAELVESSYRQVALKRMITALDARAGSSRRS